MQNPILSERRKCRRINVGEGAFVCTGTEERRLWHILDIGSGGLAFRYIQGREAMEGPSELEIITRDASLAIEKVPFTPISDREMHKVPDSRFHLRRRSVQFGDLTQMQAAQLEQFLNLFDPGAPRLKAA
jgi:hypothetical protein